MGTVNIGPFALSGTVFLIVVVLLFSSVFSMLYERRYKLRLEPVIWWAAISGVVLGRFSFVVQYWATYRQDYFSIIDLRDGGMIWQWALFGIAVALAVALFRAKLQLRKGISLCAVVALTVWGAGYAYFHIQQKDVQQLPSLNLQAIELGTEATYPTLTSVALERYLGKPIVLNLWATWCPPCRREMPVFQLAQQQYTDVNFVFANQQEELDVVLAYLKSQNIVLSNLLQDSQGELATFAQSHGLPTTLFIDATGKVQHIRMGEVSEASLAHQLMLLTKP